MIKRLSHAFLLAATLTVACSPTDQKSGEDYGVAATDHQHQSATATPDDLTLGNGIANRIDLANLSRNGPSLMIAEVVAAQDSFLVLHPFSDGVPVQTDYVGATRVPKGSNTNVAVRLDTTPDARTPLIIMLHADVNGDGIFQFGDGVTVPDAPVFEDMTLIAIPMQVPDATPVTPAIIRASAKENADKAANFTERAAYRENPLASRSRALANHYLAIVEGEGQTTEAIENLFAPGFLINFSSGPIDTIEGFEAWLQGPAATVSAARHVLHDVTVTPIDPIRHELTMVMTWDGLLPTGGRMTAKTQHDWIIQDTGHTLLIERIDVEVLEPFVPTEWGAE